MEFDTLSASALLNLQKAKIDSANLQAKSLNQVNNLTQAQKDDKALKEQTDAFEAILLNIMLKDAIKNENPLYPKQAGSDIYHSMYLEQLSQSLSGHFGYSELLFNYLKEQQNGRK